MKSNIKIATIISYVTLLAGNIISLLYTPFMLATLKESEYGLFSLVNTIISYIYLLDMGMANAIIRYNSKYMVENDKDGLKLYSFIALCGLLIGLYIYINLESIFAKGLSVTEISKMKVMFLIAIINLVFSFPFNVFNGIIMANENFIFVKTVNLVRTILNPLIMIAILKSGYRATGMLVASTIFNIVLGFVNIVYCFGSLKVKMQFKGFDKNLYKEIFKYSFYIFLAAIAYKIYWSTDQFILGMYVGSVSIAIYSVGTQLNGYFISFSNVISNMFLPKLTKLLCNNDNNELIMDILLKVSRIQFYIASLILMVFVFIGKQFIKIWVGIGYENSYYIALLVMIPQIFSIVQSLFATMLEAMNKHKIKSLIYLGVAFLNLILTLWLVKVLGAIGCALGTAIGMIVNAILNNIYYKYKLKLDMWYYWKELSKLAVKMIIMIFIGTIMIFFISIDSYLDIILFTCIFTLIYFVFSWSFVFNKYEKLIIKSILYKISLKKSKINEVV